MKAHKISQKVTPINVKLGFISIRKDLIPLFPKKSAKIEVLFDDSKYGVELNYAVYTTTDRRIHGLTGWFRQHSISANTEIDIEVIQRFKKYRFTVGRIFEGKEVKKFGFTYRKGKEISQVGEVIDFRGLTFAPINEQGVVFLFSKVNDEIGIKIEEIKEHFPDAVGRRFNGRAWVRETIEFQFKSSEYQRDNHPTKEGEAANIIVCWEHDWDKCPKYIEVVELKSLIKELPK
ncbi:MAG: hypothetical protein AB1393_03435 [Candidatus Edwardsbacteria bacterium]